MMLWFLNFSTWDGPPRHLPRGPVRTARPPAATGSARALLATLAEICVDRGYPRLDWWVLDWNPAREFYHRLGAAAMAEWVPYRLTGAALDRGRRVRGA